MFWIVLLFSLFVLSYSLPVNDSGRETLLDDRNGNRIVGGHVVSITSHPYQVSIRYKSCEECAFSHVCGGSLINGQSILTAAHCIYNRDQKNFMVVAGTDNSNGADGYVGLANKIVIHESYYPANLDSDIALIFLAVQLPVNNHTTATINPTPTQPPEGAAVTVVGWGSASETGISSIQLRDVDVDIVSADLCKASYGSRITESMICAGLPNGGKDACKYDSGGPLVRNNMLVGVSSWGIGCGRPGFPGVYVNVALFKEWIQNTIDNNLLM